MQWGDVFHTGREGGLESLEGKSQCSYRTHTGIVHTYAHKHLRKQILHTGCLSKHLKNLHFTHSAGRCFRTFMIAVQASLLASRNRACKPEKEIKRNARQKLYIRSKHTTEYACCICKMFLG